MKNFLWTVAIIVATTALPSCKSKVKDADLKQSVDVALAGIPSSGGLMSDVNNGVATITGAVPDDAAKARIKPALAEIKGLKSVVDNTTVVVAPPAPTINTGDTLTTAVQDAVKDNPGVVATVVDGVVTLTGTIRKSDLPKLMQKVNATRPRKVENKLVIQ